MKERLLERQTILNKPVEEVFSFFDKAENLNKITPKDLKFTILNPGEKIRAGAVINYRIKVFGWPFKWKTLITRHDPPYYFIDTQEKGPYVKWEHHHIFTELDPNRTMMTDKVFYVVPGWFLEKIIHKFLIYPKLQKIFNFRQEVCSKIFNN